jgi:hypothetical protein
MTPPAQEFNPYELYAIRIPLGMVSHPDLSWGAKVLYGRLALYRGGKPEGFCKPRLESLAMAMAASVDTIDRWLGELVAEGFIERKRHGRGVAECIFLPHPALVNRPASQSQNSPPNSAKMRNQSQGPNSADLPPQFRKSEAPNSANSGEKSPHPTDRTGSSATENVHHQDVQENVHHQNGDEKAFGNEKFDNEGKHSPPPRQNPEAELRDIYRRKTGEEISRDVERRIWETCELRGVTRVELIEALQEHIRNAWHNPAGFLTDFARKINSKRSRPLEAVTTATPGYAPETGPCAICKGVGYLRFDEDPALREYCECALGRDLQRADKRLGAANAVPAPAEAPKPPDSSDTSEPNDNLHSGRSRVRNVS